MTDIRMTKGLFTHNRDVTVRRQFSFSDICDGYTHYQYRFSSLKSVIFEMAKFMDTELTVIAIIMFSFSINHWHSLMLYHSESIQIRQNSNNVITLISLQLVQRWLIRNTFTGWLKPSQLTGSTSLVCLS
jgi:hypothetical protein